MTTWVCPACHYDGNLETDESCFQCDMPRESMPSRLPDNPRFNGADYQPDRDDKRLTGQRADIFDLMRDGEWRTLPEIAESTRHPPASISAQLRHLRKQRFGGHTVHRRHLGNGLYTYKLVVNDQVMT